MKEFSSQTGGRFTYVDDVINLQELALAFSSIFDECDNFIVSGCEVNDNTVTSGIVFLNGKLRVFNGINNITEWPQYIYEVNTTENIPYQSGDEKVGRKIWSCAIGSVVPSTLTPLTQKIPQSITLTKNGGLRMKDAWIGKYAVLLNPLGQNQKVQGTISSDKLSAAQVEALSKISLTTNKGAFQLFYEGDKTIFESSVNSGTTKYKLVISPDTDGFQLLKNSTVLATISNTQVSFAKPILCTQGTFGSIQIKGSQIYNHSNTSDEGEILINVTGTSTSNTYYRNTHIGDGKGAKLLSVIGKTADIFVYGKLVSDSSDVNALTLKSDKAKSDSSLQKAIVWKDKNDNTVAQLGFIESANKTLALTNPIGQIKIIGTECIDITPAIKENGVLLSEKYVLQKTFANQLKEKADLINIYNKEEADSRFATCTSGLAQFITENKSKQQLCAEIDAVTNECLKDYPSIKNYLSDMATTEESKKLIRDNIGAIGKDDEIFSKIDTGWIKITNHLFVRQIGDIVSIQGTLVTIHDGIVFELPNNIDPPRYTIGHDVAMVNDTYWSCQIEGGYKTCWVTRCNHHGVWVPISITYMT